MRGLVLAASFPPTLGGIETLLHATLRHMVERPTVVAPAPAASADLHVCQVSPSVGQRLAYRPEWWLHPSVHYTHAFWRPTVQAIGATRPRVLMAGHIWLAPLTWLLARRLGLPFTVFAYGQEVWRGGARNGRRPLDALLRGRALRAADRVFVPGTFTAGLLADWGVSPDRIIAVPYGADPRPEPAPIPPSAGASLLSVARLVPRKGIDTVIRALRELPPDVHYRVVGAGPDETRLRAQAWSMGVAERVQFLGRLDDAALASEYARCSVFVLPARITDDGQREGYGLVYFEAAAWGRPVIAGRSGGEIDAVVDGQTGILVDGASTDAVRSAIDTLLADPERGATMGRAGWQRVRETHNWAAAASVIDRALGEIA